MKLVSAAQMREIDRRTIEDFGVPASRLMELAGRAIAMDVAATFPTGRAVILCGKGNNGGDGYVAARHLSRSGWEVTVLAVEAPARLSGAAREAYDTLPPEVDVRCWGDSADMAALLTRQDVAIDALLGTGFRGTPEPPFDEVIQLLNAAHLPVFSADIPSGLDPDRGTGRIAVQAFRTITMGLPKIGMVSARGVELCGAVRVESLEFPPSLLAAEDSLSETLTLEEAALLLPRRPLDGHKGTFGLVAVAAGSSGMPGAAILAATGGVRGGAGLVRAIVPDAIRPMVVHALPEAILTQHSAGERHLATFHKDFLDRARSVVVGPGIGTEPATRGFLFSLLEGANLPLVLDADALNLLGTRPVPPSTVMTPHPGELARLMGTTVEGVESDRWGTARSAADKFAAIVVLKGKGTLVARPGGQACHIGSGNTALSRGGSGDILAGLIGSLMAQGRAPWDAARLGAFVHGMAADLLLRTGVSPRGVRLEDVAGQIPFAFKELESAAFPSQIQG